MSRLRLFTTPHAQDEIDEHAAFIAGENFDAGVRFLDAIEHACNALSHHPEIGVERQFDSAGLFRLRVWPVPHFERWLLFYRVDDETLDGCPCAPQRTRHPTALDQYRSFPFSHFAREPSFQGSRAVNFSACSRLSSQPFPLEPPFV